MSGELAVKLTSFLSASFLMLCLATAAQSKTSRRLSLSEPVKSVEPPTSFLFFRTVDTAIDCEDLGGPRGFGDYISREAVVEVESNATVKVDYANGSDLSNGLQTLPTRFQYSVQGIVDFDGKTISSPSQYTAYNNAATQRAAGESGTIFFAPEAPKGLKARVVVERRGLSDSAGDYSTQVLLNWIQW